MNKRFTLLAALVALIFASLGAYVAYQKFQAKPPADGAVQKFFALSLKDSQAKPQALRQWESKFIVLNFWATWCKPCVQEMPELEALQKEFQSHNVKLLGLGIDTPSNVADFAQKHHITYPLFAAGLEGTDIASAMGNAVGGLPFTVLITPEGRIVKTYSGRLKMQELKNDIRRLNLKT